MEELEERQNLMDMLDRFELKDASDRWIWRGGKNKIFSVQSVKEFLRREIDVSDRFIFEWPKWTTRDCNIFMWRVSMDRLPTMVALKNRKVEFGNVGCLLCEAVEETLEHILCSYDLATSIWYRISIWCKVRPLFFFSIKDIFGLEEHLGLGKKHKKIFKGILYVTCWYLWRARNRRRFNDETIRVEKVFQEIKATSYFWLRNRMKKCTVSLKDWNTFNIM
uniref:uncharacterized protein LOC122601381 n=1 Tax=Erigeron canadensis TaxID=72917 RepID=UPI001CB91C57|nr:uncharacterized protein LOC122601381 [Erigeron canadensis]